MEKSVMIPLTLHIIHIQIQTTIINCNINKDWPKLKILKINHFTF